MTNRILILLLMAFLVDPIFCGQSLVSPQSACKIRCENGGMCVFDMDRPNIHSCICLLGVYTGDRCQIKVLTDDEEGSTTVAPTEPSHPRNVHYQTEEEARRRDEERKREYERQVADRTRKEKEERERAGDEERRRQQHEQYWREETARREQQRQEAERRLQEQRARDDERRRQYDAERAQQEERRREEENRRLAAEAQAEEARIREEERRRSETKEQFEYDGEDDYPQVAEREDDEYDEGYEEITTTTMSKVEDDGSDMEMEKDVEEKTEEAEDEEPLRKEDEQLIDSIKHVFDKAVEDTVKEHPIEEDEYWDENGKKMDGTAKTEEEYGMEEGTEGWMMVKKEDENSVSRALLFLSAIIPLILTL